MTEDPGHLLPDTAWDNVVREAAKIREEKQEEWEAVVKLAMQENVEIVQYVEENENGN